MPVFGNGERTGFWRTSLGEQGLDEQGVMTGEAVSSEPNPEPDGGAVRSTGAVRVVMVVADRISDREIDRLERGDERTEQVEISRLLTDVDDLADTIDQVQPRVAVIDLDLERGAAFEALTRTTLRSPRVRLLARTATPPQHDDIARALAAGALGFVESEARAVDFHRAVQTVGDGRPYLPQDATRTMLAAKVSELGLTAAERDARLRNLVIGLIPLAGGLTAIMSLLWRRYLGQIGVRPVDLAIDPATRLVDAFFALSVLLAIVGPMLFIGGWLDLLQEFGDRRLARWLADHRKVARLIMTIGIAAIGSGLAVVGQVIMALFVGPFVAALLLARTFDLDDDIPVALRLTRWNPTRAAAGAGAVVVLFLSVLSLEALVIGPDLRPDGAHGWLAPSVLGFNAQPMAANSAEDGSDRRDVLYLGGNADLYVLVDPCGDEDVVEFVPVGSTRLMVIDEVVCR